MRLAHLKTATALSLTLAFTAPLMAQDGTVAAEAFSTRLSETLAVLGYSIDFGPARAEGSDIIIEGGTFGFEGDTQNTFTFEDEIMFAGVSLDADGSYRAADVEVADIDTSFEDAGDQGRFTWTDISLSDLYLPAGEVTYAESMRMFSTMTTGPLRLFINDVEFMGFDAIDASATFDPPEPTGPIVEVASSFVLEGFFVDFTEVPAESAEDEEMASFLASLGLETINGRLVNELNWSFDDGRMVFEEFSLDLADSGRLDLTFDVTGLTPEVLQELTEIEQEVAAAVEAEDFERVQEIQAEAYPPLFDVISINAMRVSFEDAGLTNRVLEVSASEQGTDRETLVAGFSAMAPLFLADSPFASIADQVGAEVGAYLEDPQSIAISLSPSSPVSVLMALGAAATPTGLVDLLGFSVVANE